MKKDYEFEIEKACKQIKKGMRVIIQLPDGLKPRAAEIVKEIESRTGVKPHIFLGSCYGACDIPTYMEKHYDLLLHFGHTPF